jgi:hypothetical protein
MNIFSEAGFIDVSILTMFRVKLLLFSFSSQCSVETINDGNFHIVELLTLDSSLSLSVDGGSPKVITNLSKQSTLNFDSPLYVGGELPSKSSGLPSLCFSL